jgi:hypothetical protein
MRLEFRGFGCLRRVFAVERDGVFGGRGHRRFPELGGVQANPWRVTVDARVAIFVDGGLVPAGAGVHGAVV